jgi:hypothetical protein
MVEHVVGNAGPNAAAEPRRSVVAGQDSLQRLPLSAIVAKDNQPYLFPFSQGKKLARACPQLLLIVVIRPGMAILGECVRHHNRVDRQQHGAGFGQTHQHRLTARGVAAGLKQGQSRHNLGVTINQRVGQSWIVPMDAGGGKTRMPTPGQIVVRALNNELRLGNAIMIARVIDVEVGADHNLDIDPSLSQNRHARPTQRRRNLPFP